MAETKTSQLDNKNMQLMEDVHLPSPAGDALLPERAQVRTTLVRDRLEYRGDPRRPRSGIETAAHLAGRAVFGGFFIYNGIAHVLKREQYSKYTESKGVPSADAAVVASGLVLVAGGLSIVAGTRPKLGAGLITGFLLGVSPVMHAFWKAQDEQQQMNDFVNFGKNMALAGAAMFAAGQPEPWPVSAHRRHHPSERQH